MYNTYEKKILNSYIAFQLMGSCLVLSILWLLKTINIFVRMDLSVVYILGIVVCIMFLARAVCVILPLVFKIEIHNFPIIMDKEVRCILANKSQQ